MKLKPPPINGIHNWLFASACSCRRSGLSQNEAKNAIEIATSGARRPIPAREVADAIADAFGITEKSLNNRPPPRWARAFPTPTAPTSDAPIYDSVGGWRGSFKPSDLPPFEAMKLAALLDNVHPTTCADLVRESRRTYPTTRPQDVLRLLFSSDELICLGREAKHSETRPLRDWEDEDLTTWQFVVPNPMRLPFVLVEAGYKSIRCRKTVGARSFFVVESDEGLTLDEQATVLWQMRSRVPCRLAAVIASGGKSLHGWFDCSEINEAQVRSVLGKFARLGADRRLLCPEQFVRLPLGTRGNGTTQRLLYLDPKRAQPPPTFTTTPNTPADLCPTCWTRRIAESINGPTCSCKPYVWPVLTTEQIANLQPALEDHLINAPIAPTAPSALENHPPLVPLESPWIEGAHYRMAGATEWPSRLDLYVQDPSGPWIRRHGVLISVSEP
jgi:hypothetical protein